MFQKQSFKDTETTTIILITGSKNRKILIAATKKPVIHPANCFSPRGDFSFVGVGIRLIVKNLNLLYRRYRGLIFYAFLSSQYI